MPNPVVQWQVVSPQPQAAAEFYKKLFGWSVGQDNAMGYREVKTGAGRGIDGGIWPAPPGQNGFVQLFVEVPDIDACLAEAAKLGAKVVVSKSVLPDGDAMAVLVDPTGLALGVCTLKPRG
jgi:hypothetical protein